MADGRVLTVYDVLLFGCPPQEGLLEIQEGLWEI
jgi:hypothetical protein